MTGRKLRDVEFYDHRNNEWAQVTAVVDEDYICKNPECNRITSSKARSRNNKEKSYCPKCKPKKQVKIKMEEEKQQKWRMLVCKECGFELPDTHRLQFAHHQSSKLHYGLDTYETDKEPDVKELSKQEEKDNE